MNTENKKRYKVAISETSPEFINQVREIMEAEGYKSSTFIRNRRTLNLLENTGPNVLCMDCDGFEGDAVGEKHFVDFIKEISRSQDMGRTKVYAFSKDINSDFFAKLAKDYKFDLSVSWPLDAEAFATQVRELKDQDPKRQVWRSSWK